MTISLQEQRVIHNTTDISVSVNDFRTQTHVMTYTAGQYLYVGMRTPFNNLWFEMSSPSASSAGAPVIGVWWANAWHTAVDVIDQTSAMMANGRLSWSLDWLKGWDRERESEDVAGLSGTQIYDLYWLRISWPSSFSATFSYIGQKFSSDLSLAGHYPDLMQAQILDGYKDGKTNWDEQHFMSSDLIIKDLKKREMVISRGQIFDWTKLEDASCHRTAMIIYKALGKSRAEDLKSAEADYQKEIGGKFFNFDADMNGNITESDVRDSQGWMRR